MFRRTGSITVKERMARSTARNCGFSFTWFVDWRSQPLLIFTLVAVLFSRERVSGQPQLQVAYITTDDGAYVSNGSIPAVMLAIEQVNNKSSEYQLVLNRDGLARTTSCERRSALETYFDLLNADKQPLLALIGCGCSPATEPVAEITNFNDIVHISYASSAPSLSDRHTYPGFWRTYPSEDNFSPALLAVVKQYGWRQLKILTQEESIFLETSTTLKRDLEKNEVDVDESGVTTFSSLETFTNLGGDMLFSKEIRVFVLDMYEQQARRVLCEAVKLGTSDSTRYVPGYVWITHGWYKRNWWTAEVTKDDVNCSDTDLEKLVRRSIAILQIPTAENATATTDLPLTAGMFSDVYKERLQESENLENEPSAALAYDAVWTLALALNRVNITNTIASNGSVAQEVQRVLSSNFSFQGVSGLVEFDVNGTRLPQDTRIFKYRNNMDINLCDNPGPVELKMVPVAVVLQGQNNLTYLCESCSSDMIQCEKDSSVWPGGVPRDGVPTRVITTIKIPIFVVYAAMATAGNVFVIVCLIFNIVFRERKIVKLTSPKLNYVVLLGAFMLYTSVYFYVLPSTEELTSTVYCHVRAWLQPGGYLVCFGTITLKMWRVYYIFHNPSAKKKRKVPKDWMLFVGSLVMFGVFAVIMIGVISLDDYKATEVEDKETSSERDDDRILIEHYNLVCEGRRSFIWIYVIFSYIIATQLVAVYLAFRTRKVKIKALNDAKYLTLIIYTSTVMLTIMIISTVSLDSFLNADAAVFSAGLLIFTTLILGLLFVPKMVILYKDPRGERIFNRSMSQGQPTLTGMSLSDAERDKLHDLERHCRDLETRLGNYEHVQPFRSLSRSNLFSGSTELSRTMTTSLPGPLSSITKPPLNGNAVNIPTNGAHSSATSSDHTGSGLSEMAKTDQQGEVNGLQKQELVQKSAEQSTQF